ncbi:N,N-dimethylformamidase beta subunit family domain-containing protein [Dactylosporangium sp. CA-233914]|uniref:N,N-dimethylformamidase beta subunit family domain-containing protein n=1 Tax=Dactylosporangium sp. CA-233914 TaxID=3239934 RepID=UPI003D8C36BE
MPAQLDPPGPDRARALLAEFDATPFGTHSPELQSVLERMRSLPLPGKHFLYMTKPHEEWTLARLSGTAPFRLILEPETVFTDLLDAERHVFRLRWQELFGTTVDPAAPQTRRSEATAHPVIPSVLGYAGQDGVHAGEPITFYVSSSRHPSYRADIVRLHNPEVGPDAPPFRETVLRSVVDGEYPSVEQPVHPGSYAHVPGPIPLPAAFGFSAFVQPTLLCEGEQVIASLRGEDGSHRCLYVRPDGRVVFTDGAAEVVSAGTVRTRDWFLIFAGSAGGELSVGVQQVPKTSWDTGQASLATAPTTVSGHATGVSLTLAAALESASDGRVRPDRPYNGLIERPRLYERPLGRQAAAVLVRGVAAAFVPRTESPPPAVAGSGPQQRQGPQPGVVAEWDLADGIDTQEIRGGYPGWTVNLPARAVRGVAWSGRYLDWRMAPGEYGAMHFHSDDLADAGWAPSFTLTVPADWGSGTYALRLMAGAEEFRVPFFVRPPRGTVTADTVFLVPTATYAAYANMRLRMFAQFGEMMHGRLTVLDGTDLLLSVQPELGASTYDMHRDGSPVVYSSLRRPVTNFRPKGRIYKLCQDLLITAWLEHEGVPFDVVTDEDLHREGTAAITPYRVVVTASHPEYLSARMEDAIAAYLASGGRLMYLGGNGFYNASEFHESLPGTVEVRRPGMESLWPTDHTEAMFSFTGEPAGPFGKTGRRSEALVGVAFITQGFDRCSYYRRTEGSRDPRAAFIFDGVDEELIGDFGLLQGGAAGYEIDRFDPGRGSPRHGLVLARSEGHSNIYDLAVPSLTERLPSADPDAPEAIRADMVFFETGGGGAVFSVGSIAWSGSLCHNGYDNNVAAVSRNVLRRFRTDESFLLPGNDC